MKILLLLLLPFTASAQVFTLSDGSKLSLVDDKGAILITLDAPKEIQVAPGKSYLFLLLEIPGNTSGKTIVLSEKGTTPNPTPVRLKETINDIDPRITYVGVWSKGTNQPWTQNFLNKDVSYTYVINASASFTFTGKRITVTGERRNNHGIAKVEVKQGTTVVHTQTVDMYTASDLNAPSVLYTKDFPQGTYTVTISLASVSSGRDSMVLDSFSVHE